MNVAGEDFAGLSEAQVRGMRASKVSMVYQNPGAALNPTIRVGDQVAEVFAIAGEDSKRARRAGPGDAAPRCRSPIPTA